MVNDIGFLYMCVRKPRNQICVRSRVNSAVALQSNWNDGHESNERRTTIVRKIEVVVVNLLDMNSGHKNIAEVSDFYCFTYTYIISNIVHLTIRNDLKPRYNTWLERRGINQEYSTNLSFGLIKICFLRGRATFFLHEHLHMMYMIELNIESV